MEKEPELGYERYAGRHVQPYICYQRGCGGKVCVSGVDDALHKRYTNRICGGHEDLPSWKAVLEAIKFLLALHIDNMKCAPSSMEREDFCKWCTET